MILGNLVLTPVFVFAGQSSFAVARSVTSVAYFHFCSGYHPCDFQCSDHGFRRSQGELS